MIEKSKQVLRNWVKGSREDDDFVRDSPIPFNGEFLPVTAAEHIWISMT